MWLTRQNSISWQIHNLLGHWSLVFIVILIAIIAITIWNVGVLSLIREDFVASRLILEETTRLINWRRYYVRRLHTTALKLLVQRLSLRTHVLLLLPHRFLIVFRLLLVDRILWSCWETWLTGCYLSICWSSGGLIALRQWFTQHNIVRIWP